MSATQEVSATDDLTLVRQAQQDLEKFTELYERHVQRVYRYLLVRVGHVADAQDLTSQTFIAAMENLDKYKGQRPFLAWLFGIARNKSMDWYRHSRPEADLDTAVTVPDLDEHPDDIVDHHLSMELVARKLQTIAPDRAEAISLRLIAGLEVAEVARLMDKNEAAVRMLLHRGLRDLQAQLHPAGENGS
jgi:RNA polymerase sigma-70 factor (ECF subfamily)